jgi:hypothetical protein
MLDTCARTQPLRARYVRARAEALDAGPRPQTAAPARAPGHVASPAPDNVVVLRESGARGAPGIGPDLLEGADAIAEFLFGARTDRRRVYRLRDKGRLPLFRIGGRLCARRSTLREWLADQERNAANGR